MKTRLIVGLIGIIISGIFLYVYLHPVVENITHGF